jgi:hypothetical protein
LVFGAVEVFEFVKKEIFEGFQFHTEDGFGCREGGGWAGGERGLLIDDV